MLAPMTNQQSGEDGILDEDELRWLEARARGGFGYVVTCASHVSAAGKGFPGELGIFSDRHLPGLRRLAAALRAGGCCSAVQLYHGGRRAIVPDRIAPSDDPDTGARAMSAGEIAATMDDFVAAACRAESAGFDGVQLHAAHGYLISQFLSPLLNRRSDRWGGCPESRSRFLFELVDRIRSATGPQFQLGVRLSPERFGQDLEETRAVVARLLEEGRVEYVDLSLWDVRKVPEDPRYRDRSLLSWFSELPRGDTRLGAAGSIVTPQQALAALRSGLDFVTLGKIAVLHHDYPERVRRDGSFQPDWLPVSAARLRQERLGERFIAYLATWTGFVADYPVPPDAPRFDISEYLATGTSGKAPLPELPAVRAAAPSRSLPS